VNVGKKLAGGSAAPTLSALATGITSATIRAGGSDVQGVIDLVIDNAGGSIAGGTHLFRMTFANAFTNAPPVIVNGQSNNAASATYQFLVDPGVNYDTTKCEVFCSVNLTRTTGTATIFYHILGQ